MRSFWTVLSTLVLPAALTVSAQADSGRVSLVKTPGGGIQPQAVVDARGTIHLLYFAGPPAAGDLYYSRSREATAMAFEPAVRVNSQPGSAIAVGTIRGGQLALGKAGRVHVAWNGTTAAQPANPIKGSPMLYARSKTVGDALGFEPQRNLMTRTFGLDGGGSVAADPEGNVYVGWHGRTADAADGEAGRRFWLARSADDGATFDAEAPALPRSTGACACCGTRLLAGPGGAVFALYRAAVAGVDRDMMLLTSHDHGAHFQAQALEPWRIAACPMSSEFLVASPRGVFAAWETQGKVAFSRVDLEAGTASTRTAPPGGGDRKHPALAVSAAGETLLVWAEGTGWQRGGTLAWRVFDPSGRPTREAGRLDQGIPVWGLPAVVPRPDGGFVIFH